MKLPNGWKSRSKEQKAKWFSVGRVGARRIGDYDGNDFSDKWAPTVRGQIVQCPLTKVYKYENEMDAVMAATRFRELCRSIANPSVHRMAHVKEKESGI